MTTSALRAVKFMETRIDKFRDDHQQVCEICSTIEEVLRFALCLLGPILLPITIMYLETRF